MRAWLVKQKYNGLRIDRRLSRVLCFVIFFTLIVHSSQKREWISAHLTKPNKLIKLNDYGICPCEKYVVLGIKSCISVSIVLTDVMTLTDPKHNYFLLHFNKDQIMIKDSCYTCGRYLQKFAGNKLLCDKFIYMWITWDEAGTITVGNGTTVGRDIIGKAKGTRDRYMGNYILITTAGREEAIFKFAKDHHMVFISPASDGSTILHVNETCVINTALLKVRMKDFESVGNLQVRGNGSEYFHVVEQTLKLKKRFDYERKSHFDLTIRTLDGDSVAFTIEVLDQNDERPSITVTPGILPAGSPVGSVLAGFYTAEDTDRGDNLTFSITGKRSSFLLPVGQGCLKVIKPLDSDQTTRPDMFKDLTLTVTDLIGHTARALLNITVVGNHNPDAGSSLKWTTKGIALMKTEQITISSATPVGSFIATLVLGNNRERNGKLVYRINSVKKDGQQDGGKFLQMNATSGALSVKASLIGITSLLVEVEVSDGGQVTSTLLSISVSGLSGSAATPAQSFQFVLSALCIVHLLKLK